MSPEQWDALAWWQQRMYVEGYEWEGLIEPSDGSTAPSTASPGVPREQKASATFSGAPGEMSAFGFRETTI